MIMENLNSNHDRYNFVENSFAVIKHKTENVINPPVA